MKDDFKKSKLLALFVCLVCIISTVISINKPNKNTKLSDENKILRASNIVTERYHRGFKSYRLDLIGDLGESYYVSDVGLKYTKINELRTNLKEQKEVRVTYNSNKELFSLRLNNKNYLDKEKILKWYLDNKKFGIFVRLLIVLGSLPIFFFKKRPLFHYSGQEFEVGFRYIFLTIFLIGISIYFLNYGMEYLSGVDEIKINGL